MLIKVFNMKINAVILAPYFNAIYKVILMQLKEDSSKISSVTIICLSMSFKGTLRDILEKMLCNKAREKIIIDMIEDGSLEKGIFDVVRNWNWAKLFIMLISLHRMDYLRNLCGKKAGKISSSRILINSKKGHNKRVWKLSDIRDLWNLNPWE